MQDIQQVGGQLFEIIQQVQGLVPRFEVANEGMQAQATGAGQISDTLTQLSEAAQQTVESLQQSTLAIDELNQVSGGMRSSPPDDHPRRNVDGFPPNGEINPRHASSRGAAFVREEWRGRLREIGPHFQEHSTTPAIRR
ncbi:methyl-accepting chemotaxis protein [Mesorhizobium sp. LSHC414A00]|uniref:methyl-accepting chemotaxis protein n=1 Tax=Mesorhizobium sp. LSHC414A00 TaxID=1287287 RepID=UPI0024762267|nr:methyl-accepting chemotaxis protein [Mesorhizobium sp. LSHC414A00]